MAMTETDSVTTVLQRGVVAEMTPYRYGGDRSQAACEKIVTKH